MFKFENERQAGVKCVNVHCRFCMDDPNIICDSVNGSSGDPSYADCLTYLPEKLIDNIESPNSAESKPVSGSLPEYREHNKQIMPCFSCKEMYMVCRAGFQIENKPCPRYEKRTA